MALDGRRRLPRPWRSAGRLPGLTGMPITHTNPCPRSQLSQVTKQHNDECKRLLRLMGIPVIDAPSEAEAQCASMAKAGLVYGVATEDMDVLTFGAPRCAGAKGVWAVGAPGVLRWRAAAGRAPVRVAEMDRAVWRPERVSLHAQR